MRILAVSDVEDSLLVRRLERRALGRLDLVVSCGDLRPSYLDFVATLACAPLLYVRGNHDVDKARLEAMGGTPLDGRIVDEGGTRIAGLDGSLAYRDGIVGRDEGGMRRRCRLLALRARLSGGVDVLVTHVPPRGHGDLEDLPHHGFEAYNDLLMRLRPRLMLHGHVHLEYGNVAREREHPSGTRIVNVCGHQVIEL